MSIKRDDIIILAAAAVAAWLIVGRARASAGSDLVNGMISRPGADQSGVVGGQRFIDQHAVNDASSDYVFGTQRYYDQHSVNDAAY